MTSKEFVITHYPEAKVEGKISYSLLNFVRYYEVTNMGEVLAIGASETNAWSNAKKHIKSLVDKTSNY